MYNLGQTNEELIRSANRFWVNEMCYESRYGGFRIDQIAFEKFLQRQSFHKLRIEELGLKDKFKYVHINGENVEEVDRLYVKYYILSFLIYNGSEKLVNYIVENNIFIAPNLLDNLRERIPYDAYEDKELFFLVDEGCISVTKYNIYMTDVA